MNFFKDVYQALDILDVNKGRVYLDETFVNRSLSHMGKWKEIFLKHCIRWILQA